MGLVEANEEARARASWVVARSPSIQTVRLDETIARGDTYKSRENTQ